MGHLKNISKRVDELCWEGTFFLCPEPSARHFDTLGRRPQSSKLESARHLTRLTVNLFGQTIYMHIFNVSASLSFCRNKQVKKHA